MLERVASDPMLNTSSMSDCVAASGLAYLTGFSQSVRSSHCFRFGFPCPLAFRASDTLRWVASLTPRSMHLAMHLHMAWVSAVLEQRRSSQMLRNMCWSMWPSTLSWMVFPSPFQVFGVVEVVVFAHVFVYRAREKEREGDCFFIKRTEGLSPLYSD